MGINQRMITSKYLTNKPNISMKTLALFGALLACASLPSSAAMSKKPNVVFILADDLGWADTTLYGHTKLYQTPNIERLAKRGMTFTRAYSASPLCSPSRASILKSKPSGWSAPCPHRHHPGGLPSPPGPPHRRPRKKDCSWQEGHRS